jgi:hypothetical protein
MVAAISTSTQNVCRHLYIYSKLLPSSLHLLKTVAAISTSTQNGCRHLYIYSKRLPPSLHLFKTSRFDNGGPKRKGRNVFQFMKLEESMAGEDSKPAGTCYKLAGTHFTIRKIKI